MILTGFFSYSQREANHGLKGWGNGAGNVHFHQIVTA